jgi:transcription antitermination factor NusG
VSENLQRKDIETFLPVYSTVRRWKNGDHQVSLPLFPGYTFVRIGFTDRLRAVKVPGVVRLVGFNSAPIPVPEEEIETLRNALRQGIRAEPHPYLTVGHRVRITAGPLVGQRGLLIRRKGAWRVVLSIELIQRSILVDTDAGALEPIT